VAEKKYGGRYMPPEYQTFRRACPRKWRKTADMKKLHHCHPSVSSVFVALSWSLLDEHQLTTYDVQSWNTHLAYSGATKPHEQVCADENMTESEL